MNDAFMDEISGLYFDPEGNPCSARQWMEYLADDDVKFVTNTKCRNVWVSTVYIGLDHSFGLGGPPLIYETMAFDQRGVDTTRHVGNELGCYRYATQAEALADHKRVLKEHTTWWDRNYWWALPPLLFLLTFTLTLIARWVYT